MPNSSLHLVFGGELNSPQEVEFVNPDQLEIVGIFSNPDDARAAWASKSQRSVDNAVMRYFVVPIQLSGPKPFDR